MNLAAQYIVVDHTGHIIAAFPATQHGLNRAFATRDANNAAGVAIAGIKGITPIDRTGWYRNEPLHPVRPGTPDPVLGNKVRHLT